MSSDPRVSGSEEAADERAQALVMAEYEEAFERPQYGLPGGGVRGSGFVRAGGESCGLGPDVYCIRALMVGAPIQQHGPRGFNPPSGPSRGPPTGPSAMGYSRACIASSTCRVLLIARILLGDSLPLRRVVPRNQGARGRWMLF